jgi:hypothetical protein
MVSISSATGGVFTSACCVWTIGRPSGPRNALSGFEPVDSGRTGSIGSDDDFGYTTVAMCSLLPQACGKVRVADR